MNPLSLITSAVEGIGNVVIKGIRTVKGDKAERDQQNADYGQAALGEFASEFTYRRNWFDSVIDGINRLPRPFLALGVLGLMVLAPINPIIFSQIMISYALVPEWLAILFGVIVGFYFGTRHLEEKIKMNGPSVEKVKALTETIKELNKLKIVGPALTEKEFKAEIADETKPLSNSAIEAWNRKRGH